MQTVQLNNQLSSQDKNQSNVRLAKNNSNASKVDRNILNQDKSNKNKQEIKQQLRDLLKETLIAAQESPYTERVTLVRKGLSGIQTYCQSVGKTFIFCELNITCNEYGLGGSQQQSATLFRGPSEDASVAICVTGKGALLHRNDSDWTVYCDAKDVRSHPESVAPYTGLSTALQDLCCLRTPA